MKNTKGFVELFLAIVVAVIVLAGGAYLVTRPTSPPPIFQDQPDTTANTSTDNSSINQDTSLKTYTNTQHGFEFKYPEKLSLSVSNGIVNLSHSIPFENRDGGCDMVGNAKLSPTLNDFGLSMRVVAGTSNPPYVDGTYSKGILNGKWAYMGAEGCGETDYYFPISGNRTLIVTKSEVQILSNVVTPEVRAKVLAVPGVISYEESKLIFDQILSTFKFTTSKSSSLLPQSGLPKAVEAKRQAIYMAAVARDMKALRALEDPQTELKDSFGEITGDIMLHGVDDNGYPMFGWSGFTKNQADEKRTSVFDIIQKILKLPYSVNSTSPIAGNYYFNWFVQKHKNENITLYTWPAVATKPPQELTAEDITNMKTFLNDEQIENFKNQYYSYFNIVITSEGRWVVGWAPGD